MGLGRVSATLPQSGRSERGELQDLGQRFVRSSGPLISSLSSGCTSKATVSCVDREFDAAGGAAPSLRGWGAQALTTKEPTLPFCV